MKTVQAYSLMFTLIQIILQWYTSFKVFRLMFELDSYLIWLFTNVCRMFDVLLGDDYLLFVYPGQIASARGKEPPPIDSKLHTTR